MSLEEYLVHREDCHSEILVPCPRKCGGTYYLNTEGHDCVDYWRNLATERAKENEELQVNNNELRTQLGNANGKFLNVQTELDKLCKERTAFESRIAEITASSNATDEKIQTLQATIHKYEEEARSYIEMLEMMTTVNSKLSEMKTNTDELIHQLSRKMFDAELVFKKTHVNKMKLNKKYFLSANHEFWKVAISRVYVGVILYLHVDLVFVGSVRELRACVKVSLVGQESHVEFFSQTNTHVFKGTDSEMPCDVCTWKDLVISQDAFTVKVFINVLG